MKYIIPVIASIASSFTNKYGNIITLVFGAVLLDVVTGILKAKATGRVNSNSGFKGFWKKVSLFAGLTFGFFLDFFWSYLNQFSKDSPILPAVNYISFGTIIGVYIIVNECISIFENLNIAGVKLPQFIVRALLSSSDKLDNNLK